MKYCPNCGAQLKDDAKFCTSCGTKFAPTNTQPAAAQAPVQKQAAPAQANAAKPAAKKKSKTTLAVVLGLALLLIVGAAFVVPSIQKNKQKEIYEATEQEAYAVLEQVATDINDKNYTNLASTFSKQVLFTNYGLVETAMVRDLENAYGKYNARNASVLEDSFGASDGKAYWYGTIHMQNDYYGDGKYTDLDIVVFQEDGNWVWCRVEDMSNNPLIATDPGTMAELKGED